MTRKNGAARRSELLEAAIGLFSAHGFDGTSTRAVAEAAGVTEALIFHYFPTKLALFHAVIVEYGMHSLHAPEPEPSGDTPLPEMLTVLLSMVLDTLWKNRVAMRMLIGAALNDPVANDNLKAFDEQARGKLDRIFTARVESGRMKAELTAPMASVISSALRGFFITALRSEPDDWDSAREGFVKDLITIVTPGLQLS